MRDGSSVNCQRIFYHHFGWESNYPREYVNYPSQVLKHYLSNQVSLQWTLFFSNNTDSWIMIEKKYNNARKSFDVELERGWKHIICNASIDACIHNGIQYSNNVSLSYLLANAVHYIFYNTEIRLKVIMKNSSKHLDLTQF